MAAILLGTFFAAMALAGYAVELIFGGLGLIPSPATAKIPDQGVSWDYTTWLNIVFLILAAALIVRFTRTGGPAMLKMMGGKPARPTPPAPTRTTACPACPVPAWAPARQPSKAPRHGPARRHPTCALCHASPVAPALPRRLITPGGRRRAGP